MVLRKKATETTGRSAKCDKDDFHSKLPWKSFCPYSILRIYLAGTPPTTVFAATSFVTTAPAAMMALSPTVTP